VGDKNYMPLHIGAYLIKKSTKSIKIFCGWIQQHGKLFLPLSGSAKNHKSVNVCDAF
jgi:hypothetical protein